MGKIPWKIFQTLNATTHSEKYPPQKQFDSNKQAFGYYFIGQTQRVKEITSHLNDTQKFAIDTELIYTQLNRSNREF